MSELIHQSLILIHRAGHGITLRLVVFLLWLETKILRAELDVVEFDTLTRPRG